MLLLILILFLVGLVYATFLLVSWILEPFFDWRQDGKNHGLEDAIKWNSDHSDPSVLLNEINRARTTCDNRSPLYLSVIVPAYNEAQRLVSGLLPSIEYLNRRASIAASFRFEIIIVDDGSSDDTTQVAVQLSKSVKLTGGEIRIVQLRRNRGKGFATRIGVQSSRGQYILMVDADGATLFSDIEKLESALTGQDQNKERLRETPDKLDVVGRDVCGRSLVVGTTKENSLFSSSPLSYDIAVGSRNQLLVEKDEAVIKRSFYRNLLMHAFHLIVAWIIGNQIKDTQCGFKLFTRSSARSLFTSLHIHRWAFDVELFVLASEFKHRIIEVPVTWTEVAGSKLNALVAAFQMTRDLITVKLFYYFGVWRPKLNGLSESNNTRDKSTRDKSS